MSRTNCYIVDSRGIFLGRGGAELPFVTLPASFESCEKNLKSFCETPADLRRFLQEHRKRCGSVFDVEALLQWALEEEQRDKEKPEKRRKTSGGLMEMYL